MRWGGEKSELLNSTDEAGELIPEDPVEGSRRSVYGTYGGKDGEDFEPGNHLNETTKDSKIGEARAKAGTDYAGPPHRCGIAT